MMTTDLTTVVVCYHYERKTTTMREKTMMMMLMTTTTCSAYLFVSTLRSSVDLLDLKSVVVVVVCVLQQIQAETTRKDVSLCACLQRCDAYNDPHQSIDYSQNKNKTVTPNTSQPLTQT